MVVMRRGPVPDLSRATGWNPSHRAHMMNWLADLLQQAIEDVFSAGIEAVAHLIFVRLLHHPYRHLLPACRRPGLLFSGHHASDQFVRQICRLQDDTVS